MQETQKPRVVLITEYMSSGSLKQFLKKTKKNSRKIPLQVRNTIKIIVKLRSRSGSRS